MAGPNVGAEVEVPQPHAGQHSGEAPGVSASEPKAQLVPTLQRRTWLVGLTSFAFILLQSACTAVMAVSGVRVIIGLSALAAAAGLHRPASGFHQDAIRIPMMLVAVLGSLVNLYILWRIRSLRAKPAARWRTKPLTAKAKRSENIQIALAVVTLVLVAAEWGTHHIVHNVP